MVEVHISQTRRNRLLFMHNKACSRLTIKLFQVCFVVSSMMLVDKKVRRKTCNGTKVKVRLFQSKSVALSEFIYTWLAVKAWVHLFSQKVWLNIYGSQLKGGYVCFSQKVLALYEYVYMASGMNITLIYTNCNSSTTMELSVVHLACYCNVLYS